MRVLAALARHRVEYVPPEGDYWIDILSRLGNAFRFADLEAEEPHFSSG